MRKYYKKMTESLHQLYLPMMFGLNLVALLLGLLYIVIGKVNLFWNYYGFLMLGTLLGNIWLIAREEKKRGLGYLYLFLSALWMLLIGIINTAVSINPQNQKSQSTISAVMLFSLFFLGGLIATIITREEKINSKNKVISEVGKINKDRISNKDRMSNEDRISNKDRMSNEDRKPRNKKDNSKTTIVFKNLVIIALSAVLYSGLFLAINLLREQKNGILEVFISAYALFSVPGLIQNAEVDYVTALGRN